ncbi:Hypothetical predicted protein [Mytilus galloprovincialis]|uniref:Uncharacterized protein n=1 Tax=Mytilus galloprovincialis TaxID=29158 RepID=A0A8B6HQQ1_MYTGA|nr:Hypothetical predicted protein [Mytilus galloprovincialis]
MIAIDPAKYDASEDSKNMPNMGPSTTPNIRKLQLKLLDSKEASGPDEITRTLKVAHCEIAPFFTKIFEQSYDSGEVPKD